MKGFAREKVKNGKLLYVKVDHDGTVINHIEILGDFFIYPEEGLGKIEKGLVNVPVKRDEMIKRIDRIVSSGRMELAGIDSGSIADTILKAVFG